MDMQKKHVSDIAQRLHATAGYAKDTVVYFLGWAKQLPEGATAVPVTALYRRNGKHSADAVIASWTLF